MSASESPRRQHDDGDILFALEPARHLDPVEPGQHEIEDGEVEGLPLEDPERVGTGIALGDLVAER